jgi:hypothetical protein
MQHYGNHASARQLRFHLWFWLLANMCIIPAGLSVADATSLFGSPSCSSTSQCTFDTVCQNVAGTKKCAALSCNDNTGCPAERPLCYGGKCQAPPNTGTGPGASAPGGSTPGSSNTLGDVGQPCGPYKLGNTMKSKGCKPNLVCLKGTCQMPAQ